MVQLMKEGINPNVAEFELDEICRIYDFLL